MHYVLDMTCFSKLAFCILRKSEIFLFKIGIQLKVTEYISEENLQPLLLCSLKTE